MEFALGACSFLGNQVIPATLFCRRARAVSLTVTASGSYNRRNDKIYTRLDSCLVIPPPAIVKFLGGAFVGAVPELTYRVYKPDVTEDDMVPWQIEEEIRDLGERLCVMLKGFKSIIRRNEVKQTDELICRFNTTTDGLVREIEVRGCYFCFCRIMQMFWLS